MFQRLSDNKGSIPIISAVILSGAIYIGGKVSLDKSVNQMKSEGDRKAYEDLSMLLSSGVNKIDQMVQAGYFKKAGNDGRCNDESKLRASHHGTKILSISDRKQAEKSLGFNRGGSSDFGHFKLEHCKIDEVNKNTWNNWLNGNQPNCSSNRGSLDFDLQKMVCNPKKPDSPTRNYLVFESKASIGDDWKDGSKHTHIKKAITARVNFKPVVINGCEEAREQGEIKTAIAKVEFKSTRGTPRCDKMEDDEDKDYSAIVNGIHSGEKKSPKIPGNRIFCGFLGIKTQDNQQFYYDDGFALTLNGMILASGRFGNKNFDSNSEYGGMKEFKYGKIEQRKYDSTGKAGCAIGTKKCVVPATQDKGPISIKPTKESNDAIAKKIQQDKEDLEDKNLGKEVDKEKYENLMEIQIHVTGDDDIEIDCQHSGLNLEIEYEYYK